MTDRESSITVTLFDSLVMEVEQRSDGVRFTDPYDLLDGKDGPAWADDYYATHEDLSDLAAAFRRIADLVDGEEERL